MDDLLADFVAESAISLSQIDADLIRLGDGQTDRAALDRIFRALHTIKGACGFLSLPRTEALMHAAEAALETVRDGRAPPDAIDLLKHTVLQVKSILAALVDEGAEPKGDDSLLVQSLAAGPGNLDWAAELAHTRARLMSLASDAMAPFQRLAAAAASLEQPARAPIDSAWRTLPLIVQDLASTLAKPIDLEVEGGETEIDRTALAPLRDALGHLIRNCADHGLESPDERRARGKAKVGVIRLTAVQEGETVIVRLQDDGRGLDTARIRHQAISHGLVFASDAARMSADQIHRFIFAPGFSTAETLTRHSGRGIGMDAVRASIELLGGEITLQSETGAGTIFTLTIPIRAAQMAEIAAEAPAEDVLIALPAQNARVA